MKRIKNKLYSILQNDFIITSLWGGWGGGGFVKCHLIWSGALLDSASSDVVCGVCDYMYLYCPVLCISPCVYVRNSTRARAYYKCIVYISIKLVLVADASF